MNDREGIERVEGEPGTARQTDARHGSTWLLAAFGFLAAGMAGGAALSAWKPDIGWTAPLAGFAAYLVAFRRGMILWNPKLDRTWRHSRRAPAVPVRKQTTDPEATIRLFYPDPPQASRSAWKVVR
jgi:hypothetical protein